MREKLIHWYLSRSAIPYWLILLSDTFIVLVSGFAAYVVNHGLVNSVLNLRDLCLAVFAYLPCFLAGFRLLHTYSGIVRRSTCGDLLRSALSLLVGVILVMLLRGYLGTDSFLLTFRFRDLMLQALLATVLMCGLRVTAKFFYDYYLKRYPPGGVYGLSNNRLIDMEMQDLLPRAPIQVDMNAIREKMRDRCIMVTGAAGSIGSELVHLLAECQPTRLILIDQAETPLHDVRMMMRREWPDVECHTIVANICHRHRMERIFKQYRPEFVFHAAAYKHVPMMEDNPVESILNNVDGTCKLADLAVRHGVKKFVMVSTDKAVHPTNIMGCSKRICEIYCQSLGRQEATKPDGCRFVTTRFGNVLGSNGSVIHIFRDQIRRGGPVQVTHPEVIRYFMLIPEACRLVLEAATLGKGGEIFAFNMGNPVRIIDLARRMIELSGQRDIRIEYCGLRPGEKLYEEVLDDEETVLPTANSHIKIARVREYDFQDVAGQIGGLIATARTYNVMQTVCRMKQIVPEYKSENSIYSKLDV